MKLQTQFTVPKKDLNDVDYIRKMETLEKTLKKHLNKDVLTIHLGKII